MSKSKDKGTAAETKVAGFLVSTGYPDAEKRRQGGRWDKGDIAGVPGACIEVKAEEDHPARPDAWFEETRTEAANAGAAFYMLVVKVKYKPVGRWDAWMPLGLFGRMGDFFDPQEDWTWVRMDLRLAVELMKAVLGSRSPRSSSTTG